MISRQREREKLEDDYLEQMRSFRRVEEEFGELKYTSNRYTQELEERLGYLFREQEGDYSTLSPYLSELYQIREDFQREMNYLEGQLSEKEADYRREYLQQLDGLERRSFDEH